MTNAAMTPDTPTTIPSNIPTTPIATPTVDLQPDPATSTHCIQSRQYSLLSQHHNLQWICMDFHYSLPRVKLTGLLLSPSNSLPPTVAVAYTWN